MQTAPRGTLVSWDLANSLSRKLEAIEKRRTEKPRTQKGAARAAPSSESRLPNVQLFGCGTILM